MTIVFELRIFGSSIEESIFLIQGHHRRNSGTVFSGSLGSPSSCKSAPATGLGGPRLSISSHDSGFVSTGNGNAPQPFCADVTSKLPTYALPIEKVCEKICCENHLYAKLCFLIRFFVHCFLNTDY